jgi:hypothetical protein
MYHPERKFQSSPHSSLVEDFAQVILHYPPTDSKMRTYLPVGHALTHEVCDLALALGKSFIRSPEKVRPFDFGCGGNEKKRCHIRGP